MQGSSIKQTYMKKLIIIIIILLLPGYVFAQSNIEKITLKQALDLALKHNLTVESSKVELEKAEAKIKQAWSQIQPTLTGQIQYTLNDEETTLNTQDMGSPCGDSTGIPCQEITLRSQNIVTGELIARLPILFPQALPTIKLSYMGRDIANMTTSEVKRQILSGVSKLFYSVLTSQNIVALSEEAIKTAQKHLDAAKARFEAEAGIKLDVARAELEYEVSKQRLSSAQLGLSNSLDSLKTLIGIEGELKQVIEPTLPNNYGDLVRFTKQAVKERPDIKLQKLIYDMNEEQILSSWMHFVPSLDLNWILDHEFTDPAGFGARQTTWMMMLTLTIPFYDGGYRYGDLAEKRANIKASKIELDNTKRNIELEVRQAWRSWKTSINNVDIAKRQKDISEEAMKLTEDAFDAGSANSLELIESQESLIEAQINFEIERLKSQLSLIDLYNTSGTSLNSIIDE